mmetsp:Transcript_97086/g.216551  ORF Transcript_97086/g.216551 Transcript_97086/m.216551 type:complete len:200 (-) Transcript_97086:211-810(-)
MLRPWSVMQKRRRWGSASPPRGSVADAASVSAALAAQQRQRRLRPDVQSGASYPPSRSRHRHHGEHLAQGSGGAVHTSVAGLRTQQAQPPLPRYSATRVSADHAPSALGTHRRYRDARRERPRKSCCCRPRRPSDSTTVRPPLPRGQASPGAHARRLRAAAPARPGARRAPQRYAAVCAAGLPEAPGRHCHRQQDRDPQ